MKNFSFCLLTTFIFLFSIPTEFKAEIANNTNKTLLGLSDIVSIGNENPNDKAFNIITENQPEKNQNQTDDVTFTGGGGCIVFIMLVFIY